MIISFLSNIFYDIVCNIFFLDEFMQDDTKVLLAKQEVQTLLDTIQKQQQQFSDIPDQLPLDPNIPITFTKVNMK